MAMQAKVKILTEINKEIARLTKEMSKLRKQAKEINIEIASYLEANDEIGFKCEGNALILDKTVKTITKNKKSKEQSYIEIARQYGIERPDEFLKELFDAGKSTKEYKKIKIQKLK